MSWINAVLIVSMLVVAFYFMNLIVDEHQAEIDARLDEMSVCWLSCWRRKDEY